MPSAWRDRKGWIVEYIPLARRSDGRPHNQRVPADRVLGDDPRALAQAFARDCEAACARLRGPHRASDIQAAADLGAITRDQADALLRGLPPPERLPSQPITLEQAYLAHPSAQRTGDNADVERRRCLRMLAEFQAWAGFEHVERLTLAKVQDYVAHLRARSLSWDYRRLHLLPLRRAAKMAAVRWGMADVLAELILDHKDRRSIVQTWTLAELGRAAVAFKRSDNLRALLAVALGGFVGLRPSETYRLQVGDLRADGRLVIGIDEGREAKNEPSRRVLPIPPTIATWWRQIAQDRPTSQALIVSLGGHPPKKPRAFSESTWGHWLRPHLAAVAGRELPVKMLRKAFATWTTRARFPREHIEAYLGHETELAGSITGQHYIADLWEIQADELEPTAAKIEATILATLAQAEADVQAKAKDGVGTAE